MIIFSLRCIYGNCIEVSLTPGICDTPPPPGEVPAANNA